MNLAPFSLPQKVSWLVISQLGLSHWLYETPYPHFHTLRGAGLADTGALAFPHPAIGAWASPQSHSQRREKKRLGNAGQTGSSFMYLSCALFAAFRPTPTHRPVRLPRLPLLFSSLSRCLRAKKVPFSFVSDTRRMRVGMEKDATAYFFFVRPFGFAPPVQLPALDVATFFASGSSLSSFAKGVREKTSSCMMVLPRNPGKQSLALLFATARCTTKL